MAEATGFEKSLVNFGRYQAYSPDYRDSDRVIIDSHKKTIELFEPHGNRGADSELESISKAYFKVSKNVHKFFREM